jgi:hypothetical protein
MIRPASAGAKATMTWRPAATRHPRGPAAAARPDEAADAYQDALSPAPTGAERRYLERRLAEVTGHA